MARQVDVKALVSHIVRGDGADRCRICMGDTTEGQVFLGDTVMLEDDRPVTLAELLETLTGVEVTEEDQLPNYLCNHCTYSAIDAATFKSLCLTSTKQWDITVETLFTLPQLEQVSKRNKGLYGIIDQTELTLIYISTQGLDKRSAAIKLRNHLNWKNNAGNNEAAKVGRGGREYSCPDCGKVFLNPKSLYSHLNESSEDKNACSICGEIMTRKELIQHFVDTHNTELYVCDKCPSLFRSSKTYVNHLKKFHTNGAITCGDCGRSYQSAPAFNSHQSVHQSRTCLNCNTLFRNVSCYMYHVTQCEVRPVEQEVETDSPQMRSGKEKKRLGPKGGNAQTECYCDYCNKRFAAKKYLLAHIQIVHSTSTHRNCGYCGKFLAAAHMSQHLKTHEIVQSYKCNFCGLVLKTSLGIKQHMRLHTGEKPYPCKICGEAFSASSRRSAHMKKVHDKKDRNYHNCWKCWAKFQRPYLLKKHLLNVHMDSTLDMYTCEVCDETFGSINGLGHHQRKHQELKTPTFNEVDDTDVTFEANAEPVVYIASAN